MGTVLKALDLELLRASTKRMRTGEDYAELEDNLLYAKIINMASESNISPDKYWGWRGY